jgi:psiF repeat
MNQAFAAWVVIALIMPAYGQQKSEDKKELTGQPDRVQQCSAEAKKRRLMGRDGQAFMSACLKGEAPVVPPKVGTQQDKR